MWKDGVEMSWHHISDLQKKDAKRQLKVVNKLRREHVKLTPYSLMRVNLAAQVLSSTVSKVLINFSEDPGKVKETANLCHFMDQFFDCMNVRSLNEFKFKRKDFLKPYETSDDPRFLWLKQEFLGFFESWWSSIENREGDFTQDQSNKMFISKQSYEGLMITVFSTVECVRFLLKVGLKYVLTERFCQDTLEEYFGCQRSMGRRSENPDLNTFGYNNNSIRIQKSVSFQSGNAKGRKDRKCAWEKVSDDPMPKKTKNSLTLHNLVFYSCIFYIS